MTRSDVGPGVRTADLRPVRRAAAAWGRHRWQLITVTAAAAFVLGIIGVGEDSGGASVLDRAYGALQLFSLAYIPVAARAIPPALQVARFLAPVIVAWAGLQAAAALFVQQVTQLRIRVAYRDHLVVCGIGRSGSSFAMSFWEKGWRVVAIDSAPAPDVVDEFRDRGIPLLVGDAAERVVLSRARVGRARWIVVTCGDDGVNAEVAVAAKAGFVRSTDARVFVHIGDDSLCGLLEEAVLLSSDVGRVEYFNVTRSGPQALLNAHGPIAPAESNETEVHIVIAGGGSVGDDLAVEAARRHHLAARGGGAGRCGSGGLGERRSQAAASDTGRCGRVDATSRRLVISLVSDDASARAQRIQTLAPSFGVHSRLEATDVDPADRDLPAGGARLGTEVVFVCCDDDATALRATLRLRRRLPITVPIVACTTRRASSFAELLRGGDAGLLANVSTFELAAQVCTPATLLGGVGETIAAAFHAAYVERELAAGVDPGAPSLRPWAELAATLRRSNHDLAADIGTKLETVDCEIERMKDWDTPVLAFSSDELAVLAPMEHDRWCGDRRRDGWEWGRVKDVEGRRHPDLVSWDELSEPVRDKDRRAVELIPQVLATYAGLSVVRRSLLRVPPRSS